MPSTLFKTLVRLTIATLFVVFAGASAAQDFRHIQNRWKMDQHLHIERGAIMAGRIEPGWWSSMWVIENVPGTPYVRFRNRWKPEQFLHIEYGSVQSGPIESGWHSAMWTLEPADANSHRIRNRWKNNQYLHIEYGKLVAGPIEGGWWSAQWYFPSPR